MTNYNKKIFANNLLFYLDQNEMKQNDLCSLLGVTKATISSWCNGNKMPRMDKIEKLAQIFNIQKSDLIEEKKSINKKLTPQQEKELIDLFVAAPPSLQTVALDLLKAAATQNKNEDNDELKK